MPAIVEAGIVPEGTLPMNQDVILFPPNINTKSPWESDLTTNQVTHASLAQALRTCPPTRPPVLWEPKLTDRLIYVFTSGTTGLPKVSWIIKNALLYDSLKLF